MVLAADLLDIDAGLGVAHLQPPKMLHHDARDGQVAEPFVIGRDDEPWRIACAAARESVFVRSRVCVPEGPFLVVGFADLPVLGRIVKPFLEPLQLFFLGDM